MATIKVINSIWLDTKGVMVRDANGNDVPLPKRQGNMDGACAVYSLAMAMLCIGAVTSDDVDIYDRPDRRTPKGKLLSHFLDDQGMLRKGYSFKTMAREIREFNFGIDVTRKAPRKDDDIINGIADYLDEDYPVIISTYFEGGGGHALLAVGYETEDDDDKVTKLFCLDPGEEAPLYSYWNCVIDVSRTDEKAQYPFDYITQSQPYKVALGDFLVLMKAKSLLSAK